MSRNIFIISSEPNTGGVSDYADRLSDDISEAQRSSLPQSSSPLSYISHAVDMRWRGDSSSVYNYQITYGHFGSYGLYLPFYLVLLVFLKPPGAAVVISLHEVWGEDSYQSVSPTPVVRVIGKLLHTVILFCSDAIVFLSEEGKSDFTAFATLEAHTAVRVIPHGVPEPQQLLSREDAKAVFGEKGRTTVVTIGFINERKNTELLLDVARQNPQYSVLIGGGARTDSAQSRVERLRQNAPSNATVTGKLPEDKFHAAFQAADVVILPYYDITQSGILNWCAAYSSPVVATRLEHFSRLEDSYGWPKTAEMDDIPDTVTDLLSDSQRVVELSNKAEEYAEDHSHAKVVNRYLDLFISI